MPRLLLGLLLVLAALPASAQAAAGAAQDRYVLQGDVLVAKDEVVGDVVVLDGNVVVRGAVRGDVVAVNGDVTVRGTVAGEVVTVGKRANLGRRAVIGGDVKWLQDRPVVAPGAVVHGKVKKFDVGSINAAGIAAGLIFWLVMTLSLLVGGLILLGLAPGVGEAFARTARTSAGAAVIAGIALFVLLPIVAVLLAVTGVLTPLGIWLLLALGPLLAVAYMASAVVLGRRVRKSGGRTVGFILGLLILQLLSLIPVLNVIVWLLATVFGLGVLFVSIRRFRTV